MDQLAMRVTLRQLVILRVVASHLSFSKAAADLNLSQSAVSYEVAQLERALGTRLLTRSPRHVSVTPEGQILLGYVQQALEALDEAGQVLLDARGVLSGTVQLGAVPTIGAFVMPELLGEFTQQFPRVHVAMEIGSRYQVVDRLRSGQYEIAVATTVSDMDGIAATPFLENQVVIVASNRHSLTQEKAIPLCRIAEEKFIVRDPGSGTRRLLDRIFDSHGLSLQVALQLSYSEAVKSAVEHGLGVAIFARLAVAGHVQTGRLSILDVEGFPVRHQWSILMKRTQQLSSAARVFMDFLISKKQI